MLIKEYDVSKIRSMVVVVPAPPYANKMLKDHLIATKNLFSELLPEDIKVIAVSSKSATDIEICVFTQDIESNE